MKNHGILAESHICVLLKSIEIMEGYSGFQKEVVSASKVMIYHPRPDPTRLEFQTNQVWRETKHHKKLQKDAKSETPTWLQLWKTQKLNFQHVSIWCKNLRIPFLPRGLGTCQSIAEPPTTELRTIPIIPVVDDYLWLLHKMPQTSGTKEIWTCLTTVEISVASRYVRQHLKLSACQYWGQSWFPSFS